MGASWESMITVDSDAPKLLLDFTIAGLGQNDLN